MIRQKFKCQECDGFGRLHSPWRVCVGCGGKKSVTREVADTDDRMLWGARLARLDGKPKRSSLPFHIEEQLWPSPPPKVERQRVHVEPERKQGMRPVPWKPGDPIPSHLVSR